MNLILVIAVPLLIIAISFVVFKEITWKEAAVQLGGCLLILLISWQIAKWDGLSDTQLLNGRITEKVHGTQKCCHCHDVCTSRDKDGRCTSSIEVCAHSRDHYWELDTSVGGITIDRCDGWGSAPAAWSNAVVGEPATRRDSYTNYLKAEPESLFVHNSKAKFEGLVPDYPQVYGYYKANHVVSDGPPIPDELQQAMREANAELGYKKQVDITLVLTKVQDPTYAQSLEKKWLYGPKNSVNIVAGVRDDKFSWVRVVTFSRVEALKVKIRDTLQGMRVDDPAAVFAIRRLVNANFKRTPMAEFEYLARASEPRGWGLAVIVFLQLLVSIGSAVLMHKHDLFDEEERKWRYA